jgi:hypothetical protein
VSGNSKDLLGCLLDKQEKYTGVSLQQYKVDAPYKSYNGRVNYVKNVRIGYFPFRFGSDVTRRVKIGTASPSCGRLMPEGSGEAFTILTTEPWPDVAPIHNRQVVVLDRKDWLAWLDLSRPEAELLRPLPAGSLTVDQVR